MLFNSFNFSEASAKPVRVLVWSLCITILFVLVLRHTWVGEDSYIVWRMTENFWKGHGLTWNPGVREYMFTCPLWMLSATAAFGILPNVYVNSVLLSFACFFLATYLFLRKQQIGAAVVY